MAVCFAVEIPKRRIFRVVAGKLYVSAPDDKLVV